MKYRNVKEKYQSFDLQLFAGEEDAGNGQDTGDDPDEENDPDEEDDPEEKKFSQKDVDAAVKKRLERERCKWKCGQQKPGASNKEHADDAGDGGESEETKARKAAEAKASSLEVKVACYEAGVAKDAVDDVAALAGAYMAADAELDLEDVIEKVVKKYPQFKQAAGSDEGDGKSGKPWAQRQSGRGAQKLSGVEARFYELNPDLKK